MSKRSKHIIKANFTEDYVCCSIDVYFSFLDCFRGRFWVEPISRYKEKKCSYDAVLKSNKFSNVKKFKPFYMQYKRPTEYKNSSTSRIVKFREKKSLIKECLVFPLYNKKDKSQHNGLYRLAKKGQDGKKHHAAYVCPLYIEREAYRMALNKTLKGMMPLPLPLPSPCHLIMFHERDVEIHPSSKFLKTFFIHNHVCIPPHEKLTPGESHQYSFLKNGNEVCFHSGEILGNISQRLDKWLISIFAEFIKNKKVITEDTSEREFYGILERLGEHAYTSFKQDERLRDKPKSERIGSKIEMGNWLWLGKYLREEYGICQYGLFEENEEY